MAVTQNTYTGNGSTVLFSFTFPYLETTDIKVSLNGTVTTAYTLANATTIQFNTAPANGAAIRIYRATDDAALPATFYPGSAIRADDLNENFTQNLYSTQESRNEAASATSTANTALTNSNTAISTANTASTTAASAVSTANTASANATAAVNTANTASTNATTAVNTANSASSTAASAVTTANNAVTTANTASSNASAAVTTANTAATNAASAVATANTASTNATAAVATANTASTNASNAVTTANTASSTASSAVTTANNAQTVANNAAAAVANALIYTLVANVAAIPGSPSNNDAIEVTDSTNIQSFTPLSGVPVGFTGNSGLSVRIVYSSASSSWTWVQYFANDPENRYLGLAGGTMTGALTLSGAPTTSNQAATKQYVDDNGASVTSSDVAPSSPADGDLWYNSSDGRTYVYYNDGDSSQWVDMSPQGGGGPFGQGSAASPSVSFIGDTNTGLYSPGADQLALSTNGTGRLFIDSSGQVGVGTASPGRILHVDSGSTANSYIRFTNSNSTGNGAEVGLYDSGAAGPGLVLANTMADGVVVINTNGLERLRVTATGLIGVGTGVPTEALTVWGGNIQVDPNDRKIGYKVSTSTNAGYLIPYDTSGNTQLVNERGTGNLIFKTQNIERVRIDSSGRVGIGTASPSAALHIEDTTASVYTRIISSDTGVAGILFGDTGYPSRGRIYYDNSDDSLGFWGASGTVSTERARIDSSGRLLVGTSSAPSVGIAEPPRLFVSGHGTDATKAGSLGISRGAVASSSDQGIGNIQFTDSAGGVFSTITCTTDATPGSGDYPGRLVFSTTADGASSPTERMRITSGGGIRFNQATTDTPAADNVAGCGLGLGGFVSASNTGGRALELNRTENTTTSVEYVRFYRAGSTNLAGTITATKTTTAYNTSSDYRLKENVVPLTNAADRVKQLRPSQFNFIVEPDTTVDGFIAHEAQAVVPECVTGIKDEVDDEGNPVYQGIDQSKLVPLLTAALQEAITRIETLEAEVQALKGGN